MHQNAFAARAVSQGRIFKGTGLIGVWGSLYIVPVLPSCPDVRCHVYRSHLSKQFRAKSRFIEVT